MPDKTAIIVEDARNWARQHELTLARLGFASFIAKNYADAVSLLRHQRFDLAVVDLSLGHQDEFHDLNGIFLLEHLTAKNTPIIVVTAFTGRELVDGIFDTFDVFAIMDKFEFSKNKFKENVVQATQSQHLRNDDGKKKKRIAHEKIEQLVIELLLKMPPRPQGKSVATISAEDDAAKTHSPRIFISHSSKDKALADRLAADLRAGGLELWYDAEQIHVGDTIIEMIAKGVHECDFMIVILSPEAVASEWVCREILMFATIEIERKKAVIMPVLGRDCAMPPILHGRHFADFRNNYDDGFAGLLKALGL